MIWTGFLVILFLSCFDAKSDENSNEEISFGIASKDNLDNKKVSNLLPEFPESEPDVPPLTFHQGPSAQPTTRGRSDIEVEKDEFFGGYVYPKPSKPFDLPPFKTLDAKLDASFISEGSAEEIERSPRSPQRPTFFYPPPMPRPLPNFPNGWTYPGIRPLPALYGRPQNLLPYN